MEEEKTWKILNRSMSKEDNSNFLTKYSSVVVLLGLVMGYKIYKVI